MNLVSWITNLWRWIARLWRRPQEQPPVVPQFQMMVAPSLPPFLPSPTDLQPFEPTKPRFLPPLRKHHSLISYKRRLERRRLARIAAARAEKAKTP